jgi:lysozyme
MFRKLFTGAAAFGGAALTASFLSLTTTGLLQTEDLRTTAYRDPIGIPTVCVGETRGVKMGDRYTREECMEMLEDRIEEFDRDLGKCINVKLPEKTRSAILQWAYNVGSPTACKSTLVRKLNAGDIEGACNELPRWKYADGKVLRGLVKRREHERVLCLAGIGK